jgi:hypothetical protein
VNSSQIGSSSAFTVEEVMKLSFVLDNSHRFLVVRVSGPIYVELVSSGVGGIVCVNFS